MLGVTPTVTTGSSSDDEANITDPDFSTSYTSTANNALVMSFGSTASINYVALAGINIQGAKNLTSYVQVLNGATAITTNQIIRNNCVMLTFATQSFSELRIAMVNALGDILPSVRFIAAGEYLQLPLGGENAGYNRQFLNRNKETKSSLNELSAPTSVLTRTTSPSGVLTLPNMTKDFTESEWQTFLDFSEGNYFFIVEQDIDGDVTQNQSAYLCFEVTTNKVTAHAQTRSLNNLSIKFRVFNGL